MKRARVFAGLGLVVLGLAGMGVMGFSSVSSAARASEPVVAEPGGRTAMFWGQVVSVHGSMATVDIRGHRTEMCLDELSAPQRDRLPTEAPGWMVYQASSQGWFLGRQKIVAVLDVGRAPGSDVSGLLR